MIQSRSLIAALVACALRSAEAQVPTIHPGDTVRVWTQTAATPRQGHVVSLTRDSLLLATSAYAMSDVARIDVAHGNTLNRGKMAKFIVGGLLPGLAIGILANQANRPCDQCIRTFDFAQPSAVVGAGIGWLLARKYAKEPAWFTVWPAPQIQVAEESPAPDRERKTIAPGHFNGIGAGDLVQVYAHGVSARQGRFGGLSADQSTMLWADGSAPVPLASIDALEVGHRRIALWTITGIGVVTAPVALLAAIACAFGPCESDRVSLVLGSAAVIGGITGAAVGSNRISWQLRFTR